MRVHKMFCKPKFPPVTPCNSCPPPRTSADETTHQQWENSPPEKPNTTFLTVGNTKGFRWMRSFRFIMSLALASHFAAFLPQSFASSPTFVCVPLSRKNSRFPGCQLPVYSPRRRHEIFTPITTGAHQLFTANVCTPQSVATRDASWTTAREPIVFSPSFPFFLFRFTALQ